MLSFERILPFAAGLLIILVQVFFDRVWQEQYRTEFVPQAHSDQLPTLRWAADTGAFLPAATLTLIGIGILLFDNDSEAAHISLFVLLIVGGALLVSRFLVVAQDKRFAPRQLSFRVRGRTIEITVLQTLLAGLNVAGILVALVVPPAASTEHPTPNPPTSSTAPAPSSPSGHR